MTAADLDTLARATRDAWKTLKRSSHAQRNAALAAMADGLLAGSDAIAAANAEDLAAGAEAGLDAAMLDRLRLDAPRIAALAADVRTLIELPDPLAIRFDERVLPNGLKLHRRRVPIGVLGVIYESRPNVSVDVAALAIKSGNAAILRGGKESLRTNLALIEVVQQALVQAGLPSHCIDLIRSIDRAQVLELLKLDACVDLIIPRGGAALHQFCKKNATMPVITGGIGVCHVYVDQAADLGKAVPIVRNAKVQRPSVCNALDTVLVHQARAAEALPAIARDLLPLGVELRLDERALAIVGAAGLAGERVRPAQAGDFGAEFMALILSARVVDSMDEALEHIARFGDHSDAIVTEDRAAADRFVAAVDSAAVFVNASTRFNDGGQLGLGAEIAVSTQKLHVRGPMALRELTSYKWVVEGDGHVRA